MDFRMAQAGESMGAAIFASEDRTGYPNYYFATDDIDASSVKVRELGGDAEGKMPVPGHGWFAACHDSEGNAFHLWQQDSSAG
jgi:predicted enzyme related to lactoylglutathione lyase